MMSSPRPRKYYLPYLADKWKWARPLLGSVPGALGTHWVFQGMLYMDRTERRFKVFTDVFLALVFFSLASIWLGILISLLIATTAAHTINFIFNSQPLIVLHELGKTAHPTEQMKDYVDRLVTRTIHEPSIQWLGAYGSLARGDFGPGSDIDLRAVRRSGVVNAIRACIFVAKERFRGTMNGMPVDIYVVDNQVGLERMGLLEIPTILMNNYGLPSNGLNGNSVG